MNNKYYLFLFLIICSIQYGYAQKIKVWGEVKDQRKKAVAYISVSEKNTTNGTFTDDNGKYELWVSPKDTVYIVFSAVGYQSQEYRIPALNKDYELNTQLLSGNNTLSSVTIEGRSSVSRNMQNADFLATQRAANPWNNNLEAMLATMGGVSINNELSSQYSVRGGNFDENVIYVNGLEIFRPLLVRSAQQEGLSFVNPNLIQTVNFSSGGYNAEYGDRMSSVLDISYKKPKPFEASAEVGLMGVDTYVGSSHKRFSQITGVRYKTIRSLLNTTDTKAEYNPSFLDIQSYMTYTISDKWSANMLAGYAYNTYQFTPKTRQTNFGTMGNVKAFNVYFNGWENDHFLNYRTALTLTGKINDKLQLNFTGSVFSSNERERYDIEGRYILQDFDTNTTGSTDTPPLGIGTNLDHARNSLQSTLYVWNHTGSLALNSNFIKWGLRVQNEHIKDNMNEWQMRDSAGYSLPNTATDVNLFYNLRSNNELKSNRYSAFLQDTYRLTAEQGIFIFNLGARASYWDFNKEFIFSPRGAVAFMPESQDNLTLRFATGIYYQAPMFREFRRIVTDDNGNSIVELNNNIRSPKSVHFVLGADYYIKGQMKPFKLSGEIYYKKLSDLIPYTLNNVKLVYEGENVASGYATGVDMKLYGEFVPGAESWISFSLMKAQQNIRGVTVPLPTDQRYNIALFYQDYFPKYDRLKMSLRGVFSQGLPVSAPNQGYDKGYFRTPAYKRADIGFSWKVLGTDFDIRKRNSFCKAFNTVWLGLDIFNLFDILNTNTYYWVADVNNNQYAVPNYLTGRQLNVRLLANF